MNQKYAVLHERLVKELNSRSGKFSPKSYSRIENIDKVLLNRDISVEKKKRILLKKLHSSIASAFSIGKKKLNKKIFDSFKKRIHNIRKMVIQLRSINYYMETAFLDELKLSKIKANNQGVKQKKSAIAGGELEALEYTAYKLIEKVVVLDKRLLKGYSFRERMVFGREKTEAKELSSVLRRESELLEHLEAKLPPPRAAGTAMVKEPAFTHWASRVFALLLHIEQLYTAETAIFGKIKKNKSARRKIGKKILQILREKSKLLEIMQLKAASMTKFRLDEGFKRELHNFTTTISV